jgi:hypothetical protein
MNAFNFFLISEFTQILESFWKSNILSKYRFNGTDDFKFVIDTKLNRNNDLVFTFNFYNKNMKLDVMDMSNLQVLQLLDKFSKNIENFAPFKKDLKRSKVPKIQNILNYELLRRSKVSLSLIKSIIKQSDTSRKLLYLFLNESLNIYTVDGFNNVLIARTIVRSFDRINIISDEFINNKNLGILMNLHNINIKLFNYFVQNNLSLLFQSLMLVITIVRIYILIIWVLSNVGIFAISGLSLNDPFHILHSSLFYFLNPLFLVIWLLLPSMVTTIIKFKIKKTQTDCIHNCKFCL